MSDTSTNMPYNYSIRHIESLLRTIEAKHMFYPKSFDACPVTELQIYYNGVGPESWSSKFRYLVTQLLDKMEAPALIHDFEFSAIKKTYWNFTAANIRLVINSIKDDIPRIGILAGIICQLFGYRGYKKC